LKDGIGDTKYDWFWLSSRDQASNNWILNENSFLSLRPRYRRFCCLGCSKVDEDAALQSGLDDIAIQSRCDIFHSSDGVLCFSERARDVFASNGIQGVAFLPLPTPNKRKHEVALPTIVSPVNREKSGFQWTDYPQEPQPGLDNSDVFCPLCHRPRKGTYVGPFLDSMVLPENPFCVTTPSISPETWHGKTYWILVSSVVKDILVKSRMLGIEFSEPF